MPMTEKERDDLYLKRLLTHLETTKERKFYAIQRIDILLISISGAGVYIIFEELKFIKSQIPPIPYNDSMIELSGVLLTVGILLNILSQWSGHRANKFEIECTEHSISQEKGDQVPKNVVDSVRKKVAIYNSLTANLNTYSTLFIIGGILLLTYFNLLTF